MKTFRDEKEPHKLFFTNYERRPEQEVLEDVISTLKHAGVKIGKREIMPDCDLYRCSFGQIKLNVFYDEFEPDTSIYVEKLEDVDKIDKLFDERK